MNDRKFRRAAALYNAGGERVRGKEGTVSCLPHMTFAVDMEGITTTVVGCVKRITKICVQLQTYYLRVQGWG